MVIVYRVEHKKIIRSQLANVLSMIEMIEFLIKEPRSIKDFQKEIMKTTEWE